MSEIAVDVLPGELQTLSTELATLTPHPDNPRRSDPAVIAESLRTNGVYKPIIYQRSTRHILAGNHTAAAAQSQGMTHFPAIGVDVDDTTARRILAADNRYGERGGYDTHALADLLRDISSDTTGLTGTGYADNDLEDLLNALDGDEPEELPPAPTNADWTETPEEQGAREQRAASSQTLAARGLSEMIIVLHVDDKTDLIRDIGALRQHLGGEAPTGEIMLTAARVALAVYDNADTGAPVTEWNDLIEQATTTRQTAATP